MADTRVRPVDPRLLRYASASRAFFVAIALIGAAQTAVVVAFAWLLTHAITRAIEGMPWTELTATLLALGGVVVVRALLLWAREVLSARAAARVQAQLRAQLVDAVGILGPGWLAGRNTARLAVTAGRGLEALDAYFGRYLPQLVLTAIATPVLLAVMWWQDWISGLTVLLTLPLIPLFMVLIGLATRTVQQRQWRTLGRLAARFADTVQGLSTLTVFGRQHRAAGSIEKVTDTYRTETMRVLRVSFLSGFALELLASISVAIVAVSIGFRLIDGTITLAVGLFVLLLAPEAYLPLRQVGVQFHAAAEGVAATEDVFAVLDEARASAASGGEAARAAAPALPPGPRGHLVVRELRVRRGESTLAPVDFDAAPGTITLLEGPSGAGKSSVFAALLGAAGFDGTAELDGMPVSALPSATWLAWAGQRPGLVAGTIAANVALGDEDADAAARRALVVRSLRIAQAHELDPDLDLGVQGAGLSGGQAQRVAVARAVYRHLRGHASVLALDEPSSALDAATEAALWRGIRELADAGATVLLISHRRSAREIADRVVAVTGAEVTRAAAPADSAVPAVSAEEVTR
ncbi:MULTISPECIES: thiol reductant ABC exporter subunit CydD [Microbacterium]|uniref:Thiol reductant ABC exporter subunit CydD n=1 Tax=Microbacterium hominis TaxID=162426 RepID=A0A2K9D5C5_9MICO|nr:MULTISPECIES: thiol reductant ABC exporter subunit CydD [Microbacterium]AUG28875.1 thiol reductant ABC exporter subunit CydD [Microbacterium hominis]